MPSQLDKLETLLSAHGVVPLWETWKGKVMGG
jgi:hypothetical protein